MMNDDNIYDAEERFNKVEDGPVTVIELLMQNGEKYEMEYPFRLLICRLRITRALDVTHEFLIITDRVHKRTFMLRKSEIAGISFIEVD